MSLLAPALLSLVLGSVFDEGAGVELRYTGALSRVAKDADGTAVKRFNLYGVVTGQKGAAREFAFVVSERGGGGCAWPERFALIGLDPALKPVAKTTPRLLYEYEGTPVAVVLPLPVVSFVGELKPGAKWKEGGQSYEVVRKQKVQDRECWQVDVSTNFGRKRTLWVDVNSPLVVSLEERVFVGQGDEHRLTMQLESTAVLDDARLNHDLKPLATLLKLQSALQRGETEFRPELSESQLQLAVDALPALVNDADETPFSALVSAIAKDLKSQTERSGELARLEEKFVGKPAPALALKLIDQKNVDPESLKGRIVVLHFWEYQAEPLVEPYGQIGYLDFLYGKRRKLGVDVFGVAVDARLAETQTTPSAVRSIGRLKSFMNLGYPVALDDGKLLTRFGDPRRYGAKLPLWVVIGPDGNVVHYRAGFYKINPDEGLQELDEVLVKLIREQKQKSE
jgi:peroxiredoxin